MKYREPLSEQLTYGELEPLANNKKFIKKIIGCLSYQDLIKLLHLTEEQEIIALIESQQKIHPLVINFYKTKRSYYEHQK